jgi:hypothetical protein
MESRNSQSIQIKEFIKKNKDKAPLFPWFAFDIVYSIFLTKFIENTVEEIENAKIAYLMDNGIMDNGLKYRYLSIIFDDILIIRKIGLDNFEQVILTKIVDPVWISDLYTFAEIYRQQLIAFLPQSQTLTNINSKDNSEELAKIDIDQNMFDGKYLYTRMKKFIENNETKAPLFPWVALALVYCHFLYKYGGQTIEELEETRYNCILDICLLRNATQLVYVHTMFDDFILIRKTSFENFESIIMYRILYPEWNNTWLYDLYIFAELYRKQNSHINK